MVVPSCIASLLFLVLLVGTIGALAAGEYFYGALVLLLGVLTVAALVEIVWGYWHPPMALKGHDEARQSYERRRRELLETNDAAREERNTKENRKSED